MPVNVPASPNFQATRWSRILRLQQSADSSAKRVVLAELFHEYWFPIYSHIRSKGYTPEDAEDLTQGFFLKAQEGRWFEKAADEKGRLRTFLLTILQRYLKDERNKLFAEKRGGSKAIESWDALAAEERYASEPIDHACSAEKAFARRWIRELLTRAGERLAAEWRASGKEREFEVLAPFLCLEENVSNAEAAAQLHMDVGSFRVMLCRLRAKHREYLRREIRDTLDTPTEEGVDTEIRELLASLD